MLPTKLKERIFTDAFMQVTLFSFAAIFLAYASEILFNLQPCILCIYQRIPYFLIIFFGCFSMYFSETRKILGYFIIIFFLAETSAAFYHVGVEHYIFEEDFTCKDNNQLGNMLSTVKLASSCSQVAFKFMNLSMAEWNLLYSTALLTLFIYQERKNGFLQKK